MWFIRLSVEKPNYELQINVHWPRIVRFHSEFIIFIGRRNSDGFFFTRQGFGLQRNAINIPYVCCSYRRHSQGHFPVVHRRTAGCAYLQPSCDAFRATPVEGLTVITTSSSHLFFEGLNRFTLPAKYSSSVEQYSPIVSPAYTVILN